MKTINFELSKKLSDGLLDNIDTEYEMNDYGKIVIGESDYKTLTLEEALNFLPYRIKNDGNFYLLHFRKTEVFGVNQFNIEYYKWDNYNISLFYGEINGETLLESIEEMIICLLDNNLIYGKLGK